MIAVLTYLNHYGAALNALAPVIVGALAILGAAVLAVNGGIVGWIAVDQIRLRIARRRPTGCSLDDLMDGDDWARGNGYAPARLDEQTEEWIFEAPEFQTASPGRAEAVLFAASVLADIDDWTDGGDVA